MKYYKKRSAEELYELICTGTISQRDKEFEVFKFFTDSHYNLGWRWGHEPFNLKKVAVVDTTHIADLSLAAELEEREGSIVLVPQYFSILDDAMKLFHQVAGFHLNFCLAYSHKDQDNNPVYSFTVGNLRPEFDKYMARVIVKFLVREIHLLKVLKGT